MLPAQRRPGPRQRWDPSPEARSPSVCEGWGCLRAAHQNQMVVSRIVCRQFGASLKPPGPPWGGGRSFPAQAQPPASRTLATSSHLAPPPLSPEATVRQAACPAHPPLHHPSPPRGVSSGRAGTPCCSWLCAPPARPRTGLGQQLALRKCLLRECAGLASLMHASSRPAKEDSFPIHI